MVSSRCMGSAACGPWEALGNSAAVRHPRFQLSIVNFPNVNISEMGTGLVVIVSPQVLCIQTLEPPSMAS